MRILAGNWKLHKNPKEAAEFVATFDTLPTLKDEIEILVFPQALTLSATVEATRTSRIRVGGQNIATEKQGALTGENSPLVLKELGAGYALIGHSERRQLFGETDDICARKVELALEVGLMPILCVGETWEQRRSGQTAQVVSQQIQLGLSRVQSSSVYVAYEPVWAIGTGQVATDQQAVEVHRLIAETLRGANQNLTHVPILYGGSVKPENAGQLASHSEIAGFLVGGASLDARSFHAIGRALQ